MTLDVYADLGSSPRLRGTPLNAHGILWGSGIIPALAGNTIE